MALWYALDRWAAFRARLTTPTVLLLNRYTLSNAVYQSARLNETEADELFTWVLELEHIELGLPEADLTVVLDLPPDISMKRSRDRSSAGERGDVPDVYERSRQLLTVARDRYLVSAQSLPRIIVVAGIDADGRPRVTSDIHEDILSHVASSLGLKYGSSW